MSLPKARRGGLDVRARLPAGAPRREASAQPNGSPGAFTQWWTGAAQFGTTEASPRGDRRAHSTAPSDCDDSRSGSTGPDRAGRGHGCEGIRAAVSRGGKGCRACGSGSGHPDHGGPVAGGYRGLERPRGGRAERGGRGDSGRPRGRVVAVAAGGRSHLRDPRGGPPLPGPRPGGWPFRRGRAGAGGVGRAARGPGELPRAPAGAAGHPVHRAGVGLPDCRVGTGVRRRAGPPVPGRPGQGQLRHRRDVRRRGVDHPGPRRAVQPGRGVAPRLSDADAHGGRDGSGGKAGHRRLGVRLERGQRPAQRPQPGVQRLLPRRGQVQRRGRALLGGGDIRRRRLRRHGTGAARRAAAVHRLGGHHGAPRRAGRRQQGDHGDPASRRGPVQQPLPGPDAALGPGVGASVLEPATARSGSARTSTGPRSAGSAPTRPRNSSPSPARARHTGTRSATPVRAG